MPKDKAVKSVEDFLWGQEAILSLCQEIKPQARSHGQVKNHLKDLYTILAQYIQAQDAQLFAGLLQRYKDDPHALKMIEFWQVDLKQFRLSVFTFFEEYAGESVVKTRNNLGKDFSDLLTLLETRFIVEKNYLFPLLAN